jgi:PAS domain S-box-containing protein
LAGNVFHETLVELEQEKRVIETLYRVAQAVAQVDDLHEIVQLVTDETTAITGAQFGAFFYNVVARDGEKLSLYTISGVPRERFERFPMPRATHIFRPTYEGTENVRLDDVRADPRFGRNPPYNGMPEGHLPVRSYLAVPVFSPDGSVVGGLFFGHPDVGVFSPEHERIASGIATQAGTAIEKARLLASERDARAEAETRAHAALSLEYVGDGVIMVDGDGVIRLYNRAASAITGLSAESVVGRMIGHAIPGWERIALDVPLGQAGEPVAPSTLPLSTLAGREVWLSVYGIAFSEGTVYAFRDVSEEQHLESMRADMIATVSHELRTPVAAVYGAAQTMLLRDLDPAISVQLLEILGSESERLMHLIDEILLTSQLDAGQLSIAQEVVDPVEVADAVLRGAAFAAGDVLLTIDAPDDAPPVRGDAGKISQVLTNLVENAVKYGARGRREPVRVRIRGLPASVRFEVIDKGPGVAESEQVRIFQKFYRSDPQMLGGVRGTGLGLYISRELVTRMHGKIGVTSNARSGSVFWFELPRA